MNSFFFSTHRESRQLWRVVGVSSVLQRALWREKEQQRSPPRSPISFPNRLHRFSARRRSRRAMAPPKPDSVEGIVLSFVNEQNRPLNPQNVADALQKYSIKKAAVQKALDSLADSGQISFKEYGKQKIYLARQDQFSIPNAEELDQMKQQNAQLQQEIEYKKKAASEVEAEIRALQSNLTLEEILAKESKLKDEVATMEEKLSQLREGSVLVRPEDKRKVEEMFSENVNHWKKRKRIFKDIWDTITESSPKDSKEFKEELGLEFDEDVGVELQALSELGRSKKRLRAF